MKIIAMKEDDMRFVVSMIQTLNRGYVYSEVRDQGAKIQELFISALDTPDAHKEPMRKSFVVSPYMSDATQIETWLNSRSYILTYQMIAVNVNPPTFVIIAEVGN